MLSVKEISEITGVSIRTLHYYDSIDLLKPTKVTESRYRLYDEIALNRLQNILMYRELKFPLKDIKKILDNPNFDSDKALMEQIKLLELQKKHIEKIISLAHKIQIEGVKEVDLKVFNNEEFNQYANEVKEKWSNTSEYEEFKQKNKNKSEQELESINNKFMNIFKEIGTLKHLSIEDEKVQEKIKSLQEFITDNYYKCTKEILNGLGQMYINDKRFKNNIDKAGGEGTAKFVSEAINIYCSKH